MVMIRDDDLGHLVAMMNILMTSRCWPDEKLTKKSYIRKFWIFGCKYKTVNLCGALSYYWKIN